MEDKCYICNSKAAGKLYDKNKYICIHCFISICTGDQKKLLLSSVKGSTRRFIDKIHKWFT